MSNPKISQALSLIATGKLNAALVQAGYVSEVSADKVHVVSVLTDIVNKGGISLTDIRDLVPLSTAVINAKQSNAPATDSSAALVNDA
jgi:hypothetical protein